MKGIVGVETIKAIPGKTEELKKALLEVVPKSRASEGCLQYDLLEPLEGGGIFLILMRWKNIDSLRKHENSQYIQRFVEQYDGKIYRDVAMSEWRLIE